MDWEKWIAVGLALSIGFTVISKIHEARHREHYPPHEVCGRKVMWRVMETWLNRLVSLFVLLFAVTILATRVIGPAAVVLMLRGTLLTTILVFIVAEPLLVILTREQRVFKDPEKEKEFPRFSAAVQRLYQRNGWWMPCPRLYVVKLMDMPNAFAFGMGFLG